VNQPVLADALSIFVPRDLGDLGMMARRISIAPDPRKYQKLTRIFRNTLTARADLHDKNLFLSSEELCGLIPGRKAGWTYSHAPDILSALISASIELFGSDAEHIVYFTTRDAKSWCKSTYWQNLRSNRITMSLEDYQSAMLEACDLPGIVEQVRARLPEGVTVLSADIADTAHPLGPLHHMLQLLEVDPERVEPVQAQNVQPATGIDDILRLNRSDLSDEALAVEKRAYLDSLRTRRR
jgi:hypothetical protein